MLALGPAFQQILNTVKALEEANIVLDKLNPLVGRGEGYERNPSTTISSCSTKQVQRNQTMVRKPSLYTRRNYFRLISQLFHSYNVTDIVSENRTTLCR